jgi:hypothetical protein
MNIPDWHATAKHKFDDEKFNAEIVIPKFSGTGDFWPPMFPGYLDNADHPFTYARSLNPKLNNTNKWCLGEAPEQFEESKKKMPASWKYATKEVEYKINSSGYRTREWKDIDWKNSIVILGDSCTFGVGLAEDETISHVLESKLKRPVINLGVPGCSNQQIINNCSTILNKFEVPYGVVINWSTSDRFRYYFKMGYHDVGPWDSHINNQPIDGVNISKLWQMTYFDRYNELCSAFHISRTAKALWKDRTRYVTISYFDYVAHYTRSDMFFKIQNTARDLAHPGYENSLEVAEYLKCKLKK